MCVGLLGLVLSGGMLAPEFVAALAGVTAVTTAAGLVARYQMLPETRQKAVMSRELDKAEHELSRASQRLDKLQVELDRVNTKEQQEIDRLNARQKELLDQEVKQLGRVQDKAQSQAGSLDQRRQQLKQAEQDERSRALAELQLDTMTGLLDNHVVASSGIPGVGHQAVRQLEQYGIATAGDFQDVQIISAPGNPNPIVYFTTRTGKRITIPAINSREALQLLTWRRELEQRYKNQVPTMLPLKQLGLIIAKYQLQAKLLDYQEKRLDESTITEKTSAQEWYKEQLDQVARQRQVVPDRNKDKRQNLHDEIAEKQKVINTRQVDQARLERDLAPLQNLTFKEYLKHMF